MIDSNIYYWNIKSWIYNVILYYNKIILQWTKLNCNLITHFFLVDVTNHNYFYFVI